MRFNHIARGVDVVKLVHLLSFINAKGQIELPIAMRMKIVSYRIHLTVCVRALDNSVKTGLALFELRFRLTFIAC